MDFSGDELTARFKLMPGMPWVWPPPRMPVASEGLVRDFLLKMVHNPGGDWNPGRGPYPSYAFQK